MCPFISGSLAVKATYVFKSMEWFFWGWAVLSVYHIAFTKQCFSAMIRFINWLFRIHHFDGQISGNPKAFARYRQDIIFLFLFNAIILLLIRLL